MSNAVDPNEQTWTTSEIVEMLRELSAVRMERESLRLRVLSLEDELFAGWTPFSGMPSDGQIVEVRAIMRGIYHGDDSWNFFDGETLFEGWRAVPKPA